METTVSGTEITPEGARATQPGREGHHAGSVRATGNVEEWEGGREGGRR